MIADGAVKTPLLLAQKNFPVASNPVMTELLALPMAMLSITLPKTGLAQNDIVTSPIIVNGLAKLVYCVPANNSEFPLTPLLTTVGHHIDGVAGIPGQVRALIGSIKFSSRTFTPNGSSKLKRAMRLLPSTSVRVEVGVFVNVLEGVSDLVNVRVFDGVSVMDGVDVFVRVSVLDGVDVFVRVGVLDEVGVFVRVDVSVGVLVFVGVLVVVAVSDGVNDLVGVGVIVAVLDVVGVAVGKSNTVITVLSMPHTLSLGSPLALHTGTSG